MIDGLRTVLYPAPNLDQARAWYELAFERKPYFDEPFHVGFDIGDFELGLVPDAPVGAGARALRENPCHAGEGRRAGRVDDER